MFFKKVSIAVLALLLSAFAVGCSKGGTNSAESPASSNSSSSAPSEETPEAVIYTVRFNSDGGTAVADQKVESNGKAQKPVDPTKKSATMEYEFLGWYVGNDLWDFDNPITSDVTIKAKWQVVEQWSEPLPIK